MLHMNVFSAFLITDMESKKSGITTSGATCVSALLHNDEKGHKQLYIANVGDSRAVLCSTLDDKTGYNIKSWHLKMTQPLNI